MLGFLKTIVVLAVLAAAGYFAFFVPLGDRTLYRHLVGISETAEARALKDGLSEKATGIRDDVVAKLPTVRREGGDARATAKSVQREESAPLSTPTAEDRRALERLIERAEKTPEKK